MTSTPWGGLVSFRTTTTSTMDDAQILEDAGVPDGSVAWAGFQTAGRGRHSGRTWHSDPGASLLFTVFWNPSRFRVLGFAPSLTVGLGVCRWVESLNLAGGKVSLKWPNDVYWGDRKLAGILVRRRLGGSGTLHAGIGVNLTAPQDPGFRTPAASLEEAGRGLSPAEALEGLLPHLAAAIDDPDPHAGCEPRLWSRGRALSLTLPDGTHHQGKVLGLDHTGALLLEGVGGSETLNSGE